MCIYVGLDTLPDGILGWVYMGGRWAHSASAHYVSWSMTMIKSYEFWNWPQGIDKEESVKLCFVIHVSISLVMVVRLLNLFLTRCQFKLYKLLISALASADWGRTLDRLRVLLCIDIMPNEAVCYCMSCSTVCTSTWYCDVSQVWNPPQDSRLYSRSRAEQWTTASYQRYWERQVTKLRKRPSKKRAWSISG